MFISARVLPVTQQARLHDAISRLHLLSQNRVSSMLTTKAHATPSTPHASVTVLFRHCCRYLQGILSKLGSWSDMVPSVPPLTRYKREVAVVQVSQ